MDTVRRYGWESVLLAFLVERSVWLVLAMLAPFAVPIFFPEVRAVIIGVFLLDLNSLEYLYAELPWGIVTPLYVLWVVGVTAYGPVVWNRERLRGRGRLAEIKGASQYHDGRAVRAAVGARSLVSDGGDKSGEIKRSVRSTREGN